MESRIALDVWSDYVCPFCYLELPVLQRLQREHDGALAIRWHAFELHPEPEPVKDPACEAACTAWTRSVEPLAVERGVRLRRPTLQPRSRRAQEAAEFARESGRFDAMHCALFEAYFGRGEDIGSLEVLVRVGRRAGLPEKALRAALKDGRCTVRVLDDEREAVGLVTAGTPLLVLRAAGEPLEDGAALSGAHAYETIAAAVARLRAEAA
jgi:predicted DsbA family dithiol-disulfide isomerase